MAEEKKEEEVVEETVDNQEETVETTDSKEESLESQMAKLQEEVNTWKTDYYKVFADMENLKRKIGKRTIRNSLKFMMQSLLKNYFRLWII